MDFRSYRYRVEHARGIREFDLFLPQSVAHRRMAAEAARQGVRTTTQAGTRGDNLPVGQTLVAPQDERDARRGMAMGLIDTAGPTPLVVASTGAVPWQYLKERADEARHYGEDRLERPGPRPDMQQLWQDYVQAALDAKVGRRKFYT